MQVETLKIFCDLAQLQSFSKTADKHFLSQSAVSQQLAQLELTHKCQLIERKKRPIELTKEGQIFYKGAKEIVAWFDADPARQVVDEQASHLIDKIIAAYETIRPVA